MQDLTLHLAQVSQYWEDKAKNFSHIENIIKNSKIEKEGILILPEMFNTGFSIQAEELAEDWEDSMSVKRLKAIAKKYDIAITTSLIIKEGQSYYNRHVFIYDEEVVGFYDKNYLFSLAKEDQYFTPGNSNTIVNYKGWKLNLLICYDLRFPEVSRVQLDVNKSPNYDLLIYVANWPEKRISHWNKLLVARAIENLSFCVGVNRVGLDGNNLSYNGSSKVINMLGEEILVFQDFKEEIKSITLSKSDFKNTRQRFGFLRDIKS